MNIHNAECLASARASISNPATALPEIALAGRSSVGKSSVINKMLGRKNLARTGSEPRKTDAINFYNIDNAVMLADLPPACGYASEKKKWDLPVPISAENRADTERGMGGSKRICGTKIGCHEHYKYCTYPQFNTYNLGRLR